METASFSGLLDTILFIFAFYYIMKFLARLFLPMMAQKMMDKAAEQFQQQQQSYQQHTTQTPTPETPKSKKIVGEYVDFEEVE
ncbi:DUF4834 domain-containing protein [Flavobacterium sp. XGLA_31]|uniref:DUF4834 domain-containing protein n=1 Tax=Flavobacterium sp. XGLA_31 TaxID=3447666 RepID=UPI003F3E9700